VIFRRPYKDVIRRQLALFAEQNADLIADVRGAERAYDRAERAEAEERFGDYSDLVETATEALAEMRDHFAATLDDEAAEVYTAEFNRAVLRQWPPFALELE
jgi:class 3 adenylate cyclase